MTAAVWLMIALGLFAASIAAALAAFSLRDFSRTRLEELCRERGLSDRYGAILKRHDDALLLLEVVWTVLLLFLGVAVAMAWQPHARHQAGVSFVALALEGVGIAIAGIVGLMLLPWGVSRVRAEWFLMSIWPFLSAVRLAGLPFVSAFRRTDRLARRLAGLAAPSTDDTAAITEEILSVIDEGHSEGAIETEARTMMQRVLELQDVEVAAIMTTRTEMLTLPADATIEQARHRFLEGGHSRIPLIGETTDDVVGILYAKDLLRHLGAPHAITSLREMARSPLYIPETTGIGTLLETMKRDRVHFAIVVDEHGGVAGLVTLEDILEEIVGDISDEHDSLEGEGIVALEEGTIEVESWVRIVELNLRFGLDLPEDEDFDTIGGFVVSQLGRIPAASESLTWRQLRMTVLSANNRRIDRLRIEFDHSLAAATPQT